jgi:hypothetical protein
VVVDGDFSLGFRVVNAVYVDLQFFFHRFTFSVEAYCVMV